MTPEQLEEIKKNVDLWLDDDGSVVELITTVEEAWAEVERLRGGQPDVIVTWGTGETTGVNDPMRLRAEQAEAEVERLKNETIYRTEYEVLAAQVQYQHQHRNRKWLVQELHGLQDAYNTLEDDRDKWMGQFDEAEHRGLAYMEERDKLGARVNELAKLLIFRPHGTYLECRICKATWWEDERTRHNLTCPVWKEATP